MSPSQRAAQRGVTMVSVMMLTVSLLTLGLLAVKSSVREVTHAGQLVARERATMAAQAAVDLAATRYMRMTPSEISDALVGFNPGGEACSDPCQDCIPGPRFVTGRRNDTLAGENVGCGGRPCMRQGALARLPDNDAVTQNWCDVPLRGLVPAADAEARITLWVRNNSADALGPASASNSWVADSDGRVVITAMAAVRNTTVTVEKEIQLQASLNVTPAALQSPDQGYGGGHNNDNTSVSLCADEYVAVTADSGT